MVKGSAHFFAVQHDGSIHHTHVKGKVQPFGIYEKDRVVFMSTNNPTGIPKGRTVGKGSNSVVVLMAVVPQLVFY